MRRITAAAITVVLVVAAGLTAAAPGAQAASAVLVPAGATWRVMDSGADLGTSWRSSSYPDSDWRQASAQLGHGDGDETATVATGHTTYYFRRQFQVTDPASITGLTLRGLFDDGAAVYVNGVEVWRINLAAAATAQTFATTAVWGTSETTWQSTTVPAARLVSGTNVIAVEVHNSAPNSSDISFDAELLATTSSPTAPQEQATVMCRIDNPQLPEISGMTASVRHPGIVWVHNDSGDSARIFAVDVTTCAIRATVTLAGITAWDFEAISMGRDPAGGPELWVGDIGDNPRTRPNVRLYRFREPASLANQSVTPQRVTVTWSDGARDCETLLVEPVPNGRVFLVSKETTGGYYRLQGDFRATGVATTGTRFTTVRASASDGAIAPDRNTTVIRYYGSADLFVGVPGSSPRRVTLPSQSMGEAIAFTPDSTALYLAGEGATQLIRVPLSTL